MYTACSLKDVLALRLDGEKCAYGRLSFCVSVFGFGHERRCLPVLTTVTGIAGADDEKDAHAPFARDTHKHLIIYKYIYSILHTYK